MPTVHNHITVPYTETSIPNKSPQERRTEEGVFATQYLKCAWEDRFTLVDQLYEEWEITQGSITFIVGHEYPHYAGSFVTSISSIEGFGKPRQDTGDGSLMKYEYAILAVQYEPKPFEFDGGGGGASSGSEVLYEEEFDIAFEFLNLPNKTLYWDDTLTEEDKITDVETPGFLSRFTTWNIQYDVTGPIPASIKNLAGFVNNSTVTSKVSGLTFAAETLLYYGPRISSRKLSNGTRISTLNLSFGHRPLGWNKFYRTANSEPQVIYGPDGYEFKPYDPVALTALGV